MKKLCLVLCCLASLAGLAADGEAAAAPSMIQPLLIGTLAPDASLTDAEGQVTSLEQLKNSKPTVLIFYRGSW